MQPHRPSLPGNARLRNERCNPSSLADQVLLLLLFKSDVYNLYGTAEQKIAGSRRTRFPEIRWADSSLRLSLSWVSQHWKCSTYSACAGHACIENVLCRDQPIAPVTHQPASSTVLLISSPRYRRARKTSRSCFEVDLSLSIEYIMSLLLLEFSMSRKISILLRILR